MTTAGNHTPRRRGCERGVALTDGAVCARRQARTVRPTALQDLLTEASFGVPVPFTVKFSAENVCRYTFWNIYILNQCNAHPSVCGMSSIVLSATLHLFALDLFLNGASGFSTTVDHETAFCSGYNKVDH